MTDARSKKMDFGYTLTEKEVYDGLRYSGIYKTSGKRAVIETVVLVVFCIFFLVSYFTKWDTFSLVMACVSAGVTVALNLVPRLDMRKQAKSGQMDIKIRMYENKFYIDTDKGSQCVMLDGTSTIKNVGKDKSLITAILAEGGLLIIPVRAIPQEMKGRTLSLLLQHDKD